MAQLVKALAAKPDKLSLIPKTHTVEKRTNFCESCPHAHSYTHTHEKLIQMVCSVTHSFPSSHNWKWSSPLVPLIFSTLV